MKQCMLAEDWDPDKVPFPVGLQPKIDGVRGYYPDFKLLARSKKEFANPHIQQFFSNPIYKFLDGEFACESETHPDLCRITSSLTRRQYGEPYALWHVFDYVHPDWLELPYINRYNKLTEVVTDLQMLGEQRLRLVPMVIVHNMEELEYWRQKRLKDGYEGTIIRRLDAKYKQGRSTVKQGQLLRIKDFIDFEFIIDEIVEGDFNGNEAMTNERGYTERSTHQENMVPNGMVGALIGRVVKDVKDPQTNKVLLTKDQVVKVSPGEMNHDMRKHYFENQDELLGEIGKAKFFPKGHKEKPRFPIFQSLRSPEDT